MLNSLSLIGAVFFVLPIMQWRGGGDGLLSAESNTVLQDNGELSLLPTPGEILCLGNCSTVDLLPSSDLVPRLQMSLTQVTQSQGEKNESQEEFIYEPQLDNLNIASKWWLSQDLRNISMN